jgi:hypothetical protein
MGGVAASVSRLLILLTRSRCRIEDRFLLSHHIALNFSQISTQERRIPSAAVQLHKPRKGTVIKKATLNEDYNLDMRA